MFSAEMSVSLIYLCSGLLVPGKQQAQHVWELLGSWTTVTHSPAKGGCRDKGKDAVL